MIVRSLFISTYLTMYFFALQATNPENIFTQIYEKNSWGSTESVSGPGSTLLETEKIREEIPGLLKSFDIKVLLDAPCGDFNWLKEVDFSSLEKYIGVDIVQEIISNNSKKYTTNTVQFLHKNIISDLLPTSDLIMCRDCLVHFPFSEIKKTIANFKKTGARYLLTTTFPGCTKNKDIAAVGGWRPLNLELPPFNFPKPLVMITEEIHYNNPVYVTKSLALWKLENLNDQNTSLPQNNRSFSAVTPEFDDAMICHERDLAAYNTISKEKAHQSFSYLKDQYNKHVLQNQEYSSLPRIPKIIHQIWIGPKQLPERCQLWMESWLKLNPDWEYILWTNENSKELKLVNQIYYDEETNWGAKSDILRYEILEQFGGVYVDIDFECIKSFDVLHHSCDFYAGLLEVKRLHNKARMANAIIGCPPHHFLLQKLIEEIPNFRKAHNILDRVGPDFFTMIINKYMPLCPGISVIFPSNYFFSWSNNSLIIKPETMAIHYYTGTWH